MDRILKITMCLFIVILVTFATLAGYDAYVTHAYRTSLSTTYTYSCTITTNAQLTNVTLFIPVPADNLGNSPIISQLSAHTIRGIPEDWRTDLYDTGKSTLLKITVPSIVPPAETDTATPFVITFATNITGKGLLDTKNPVKNSAMFRPVQDLADATCTDGGSCYTYTTSMYADYQTGPGTVVTVSSAITGRNAWKIFEPAENWYITDISGQLTGEQKGWTSMKGNLVEGGGSLDAPLLMK